MNCVKIYIWKRDASYDKPEHISLQLVEFGKAEPKNYLSFWPKTKSSTEQLKDGKALSVMPNGLFNSFEGDSSFYDFHEERTINSLDFDKMAGKIEELKQSLTYALYSGSSLLALKNYRNCVGAVSEVLHAGGIKKFFIKDQITKTAVSNIIGCLAVFAVGYYLDGGIFSLGELLSDAAIFSAQTILPATIIARLISYFFDKNESDCFLLGISISSILFEVAQGIFVSPWSVLRLVCSIVATTGVMKFIPKLFSESVMPTITSFALGSLIGRLLDGFLGHYLFNDGGNYVGGIIWFLNQLTVSIFTLSAIAGQLIPDLIVVALNKLLEKIKSLIPECIFSAIKLLCDQISRFSWFVEKPGDFEKLLDVIEKAEVRSSASGSLSSCSSSFFNTPRIVSCIPEVLPVSEVDTVVPRSFRR